MAKTLEPGGTLRAKAEMQVEGTRAACLIVALDAARPLDAPSRHWLIDVDEVAIGRSDRARIAELQSDRARLRLRVPDALVSARHATLRRAGERWVIDDERSTNETFVNGAALERAELVDGDVITVGGTFLVFRDCVLAGGWQPAALDDVPSGPAGIQTMSPELQCRFADLTSIARTTSPIVILGHTGTGKELAALAVHELSERRGGPFVAVNCGSIAATLLEGELFGHAKGAFTGALRDRDGLIAAADHGTLFLDEIGELSPAMQASLLRVLQSGELRPLGSTQLRRIDLRVVAATNRDLPAMVHNGAFRDDLWARLSGFTLKLPALRDRREDLGLLLRALLRRGGDAPRALSRAAAAALFAHDWPFNIRELEKVVEHALAISSAGPIEVSHFPPTLTHTAAALEQDRRRALIDLLRKHGGNIAEAARELGKHRQQVQKWCKRFQIDVDALRSER